MGIDDLFSFDKHAYRRKMLSLSTSSLQSREIQKTRQITSAATRGLLAGTTLAATGGVSAPLSIAGGIYAVRAGDIASQKLDIIKEVLQSRGVQLRGVHFSDVALPVSISTLTLGVCHGLEQVAVDTTPAQSVLNGVEKEVTEFGVNKATWWAAKAVRKRKATTKSTTSPLKIQAVPGPAVRFYLGRFHRLLLFVLILVCGACGWAIGTMYPIKVENSIQTAYESAMRVLAGIKIENAILFAWAAAFAFVLTSLSIRAVSSATLVVMRALQIAFIALAFLLVLGSVGILDA